MTLYRATKDGNVPMTAQEEAEILAEWNKPVIDVPKKPTIEERIAALEVDMKLTKEDIKSLARP